MEKITSYNGILYNINIVKSKGRLITNFFPSVEIVNKWIAKERLTYKIYSKTLFLVLDEVDYKKCFFVSQSMEDLKEALNDFAHDLDGTIATFELIGKEEDVISYGKLFEHNKFYKYVMLGRMIKYNEVIIENFRNKDIYKATREDVQRIKKILYEHFDKYAEHIPDVEEIIKLVDKDCIKLTLFGGEISGIIVYDMNTQVSHLKYWLVLPEHQKCGIGSILLKQFLYDSKFVKKHILWVIESNEKAISIYKHYGFYKENFYDLVMINKDIRYEIKNN